MLGASVWPANGPRSTTPSNNRDPRLQGFLSDRGAEIRTRDPPRYGGSIAASCALPQASRFCPSGTACGCAWFRPPVDILLTSPYGALGRRARSCFFCHNRLGSIRGLLVIGQTDHFQRGKGMKIRHPLFVGLVAAFTVSLASVSALAAETPFKGTVNADETGVVTPPTASVTRDGTGTATYLGKFTEHITLQIILPTGHATGAATFTAANGDTLTATVDGQGTPTAPRGCSRSSRSTPSQAERDASPTQPAPSRCTAS